MHPLCLKGIEPCCLVQRVVGVADAMSGEPLTFGVSAERVGADTERVVSVIEAVPACPRGWGTLGHQQVCEVRASPLLRRCVRRRCGCGP